MYVTLVALTERNPALTPEALADCGDLATILAGKSTYPEAIMEFAGRVCYNSTQRMGTAPEFIAARVREQHEDIVEHVVVTVRVHGTQEPMGWRLHNRHCEVSQLGEMEWLVSANVRVWLDFFRKGIALAALPLLWPVAPAVFREISAAPSTAAPSTAAQGAQPLPAFSHAFQRADQSALLPIEQGPMRVTLLGYTQPVLDDPALLLDHGAATFFFEGISRACTHQLVRHRLASFSQESQRYVALSKGGWQAIVPPAVAANPEAQAELAEFWQIAEQKYTRLRELGIRKEDARFLLPNAAQTRIVATMNYAAWSHFLWLRAVDKAAQWEIRALGQAVLHVLYCLAPAVFAEQWRVYQEQIAS
jgi:thymidylate synthase (FAD)